MKPCLIFFVLVASTSSWFNRQFIEASDEALGDLVCVSSAAGLPDKEPTWWWV
jgi:hypothetical protein